MLWMFWVACTTGKIELHDSLEVVSSDSGAPDSGAPDSGAPDSGPPDSDPPDSSYAGTWRGVISGFAAFEEDWKETPYCTGSAMVSISKRGEIAGGGDCIIAWGPYEGEIFIGVYTGSISEDGSYLLRLELLDPDEEHGWDVVEVSNVAHGLNLIGQGNTYYYPVGLSPIDAIIELAVAHSD